MTDTSLNRPAVELGSASTSRFPRTAQGRWLLLAAPAGVLLTAITIVSGGEPPSADASAAEIVRFYDGDALAVAAGFAGLLAAVLLGLAGAAFATALRSAGDDGPWPRVAAVGGAVLATGILLNANLLLVLAQSAGDVPPAAVQAINAIAEGLYMPLLAGMGLLVAGVAASARRVGLLPRWATALGLGFACCAPFGPLGFVTFVLGGAWLAAAGAVLSRR